MLSENFLREKYNKEGADKILKCLKLLSDSNPDLEILEISEEIAKILVSLKLDAESVCAGLIFNFVKNGKLSEDFFSDDAEIKNLTKMLLRCDRMSKNYSDAEGLKEMLIAISKDIRVIIIKTADMLVFARKNVKKTDDNEVFNAFKSIDDIFSPISARLGLSEIKSELQDLSFQFHDPEGFEKLKQEVAKESRANKTMIDKVVEDVKILLKNSNINCTCYGRIKHLSSIHNKIKNKNYTLKNIYDISAIRILVGSVAECYMALGIIHSNFTPVDGRFKDYIANPKPNGYQSLHTTVYFKNEFFEVQIRTYAMHDYAEYGVAAHFLYKEHKKSFAAVDSKLLWIRKLLENKDNVSSQQLLDELKTDVYLGEIFVQTPKGKVIKLVENATPVDFAYAIHTDIGNKCNGARVNGVMAPLFSNLQNGDVVEILTSNTSKGPSRDWIKKVKMSSTREKIKYFFKKQMKEENIRLGKLMVEQYAKLNDIQLSSIMREDWISEILKKNSYLNIDELYAAIGYGSVSAEKIVTRLLSQKISEDKKKNLVFEGPRHPVRINEKMPINGTDGTLTKFCKCCNPLPGDEIVGFVSRGRGIIIHKKDCENALKLPKSRFVDVQWNTAAESDMMFVSSVLVISKNSNTIYTELTNAMSEIGVKIASINTSVNKLGELLISVGVYVKNNEQLIKVKNKINSIEDVFEVK